MAKDFSSEQWKQIYALAQAAIHVPPPQRPAFVQSGSEDPELINEIFELIPELEDAAALPSRIGSTIGRFEVVAYLGAGGAGEVYAAHDPELDRRVAIKILQTDPSTNRNAEARFIREARTAGALNHPNIVTVHEFIRTESTLAIVMELVDGVSLRELCGKPMLPRRVLDIARQTAAALSAAHTAGVVHRDLKPENVMVKPDGRIVVLDFGLARRLENQAGTTFQTLPNGIAAGTLRYMSPEHYKGEPATAESDIFAFGLMLYELSTGRHPFSRASPLETLHAIALEETPRPSQFYAEMVPRFENLLLSMLAKDCVSRPTAPEVAEALQECEVIVESALSNLATAIDRMQVTEAQRIQSPSNPNGKRKAIQLSVTDQELQLKPKWAWLAIAAGILVIAGAVVLLRFTDRPIRRDSLQSLPLTGNAGIETTPAFSPDGKQVAFSWDGNRRNLGIFIKRIGTAAAPQRLTHNTAAHDFHPAWSADGQRIAFLRVSPDKTQVIIVPATGGAEVVLAETSPTSLAWHPDEPDAMGSIGPSWSPDGSYLLLGGNFVRSEKMGLIRMSLDGHWNAITDPPTQVPDASPTVSPSAKYIAFVRQWAQNSCDLFVMPTRGGTPVRVTFDSRDIQGLTWLGDKDLVYSSDRGGNFQLWRIARTGGEPQMLSGGGLHPNWPAVSVDNHWLAFTENDEAAVIWKLPLKGPGALHPQPFISSAGSDNSPSYSLDGERVVFVSDRSGKRQLWIADADGGQMRQLTSFEGASVGSPRWSPDNTHIVFDGALRGQSAIWLVDADGNNLHRLNNSTVREYLPTWSRDGKWIYFLSLRGGSEQLWKQNPASGEVSQVTRETLFDAIESPLGDVIFAQKPQQAIWQIPHVGAPVPLPELSDARPSRYWALAQSRIYFVRHERTPRELDYFELRTRRIRKLTNIAGALLPGTPGIAVDPNGAALLFVQRNRARSTIVLQEMQR